MYKDVTYYLVRIYNKAIYYKYISDYSDNNNYTIYPAFSCDYDSLENEYIFHQENDELIREELIREY